jgi:hypothetical protein
MASSKTTPIRLGDSAIDLVSKLPRVLAPSVKTFTFIKYVPTSGADLGSGAPTKPSTGRSDVPATVDAASNDFLSIVKRLLRHIPDRTQERQATEEMTARNVMRSGFKQGNFRPSPVLALALGSKCELRDGTWGHIPMMDFHCEPSPEHLALAGAALIEMGQLRGAIVNSGGSYHYYGFDVIKGHTAWTDFIGNCLLLTSYTDTRYIAHRLINGACSLRITASKGKPKNPRVEGILRDGVLILPVTARSKRAVG